MTNPLYYFPNRRDAWGQYNEDGSAYTAEGNLTDQMLDDHIKGIITIGLHSTNSDTNTCKWGFVDIDDSEMDYKKTLNTAQVIWDLLNTEYHVKAWIDFSGKKGYHVGFKCQEIDASYVFNLLVEVKRKAEERLGIKIGGETYPKQPLISDKGFGNWIKMPLGIHKKTGKRCLLVDPISGQEYTLEESIKVLEEMPINKIPRIFSTNNNLSFVQGPTTRTEKKKEIALGCFKRLLEEGSDEGNRHYSFMLIVHKLWANGYSYDETKNVLIDFNNRCEKPKPIEEIERELNFQWGRCESGKAYKVGCNGSGIISQILKSHCIFEDKTKCEQEKYNPIQRFKDSLGVFTNYLDMAKKFVEIQPVFYDSNRIWWLWDFDIGKWDMVDEVDIMNCVDEALKTPATTIKSKDKQEILEALKRVGRKSQPEDMPKTWVQFKNKIMDVLTGECIEPSPKYFCTNPIPWELCDCEDTPTFDKVFKEWVIGKEQSEEWIKTLYEILAYCMLPDYPIHRAFALCGSGSNGKGCFISILTKLMGKDNVVSSSIESIMQSRFETSGLYRKLACLSGETNFGTISKTDMFKRITGHDPIRFEFKGKNQFTDYNYAKIIVCTNSLPPTLDKTDGYYRRWLTIDFPNKFTEQIDVLNNIPEKEYNCLATKCYKLLNTILKNRVFSNEGTIEDRKKRYESRSNPIINFIVDNYDKDINGEVRYSDFYESLLDYLNGQGFRKMSMVEVTKILKAEGFDTKNKSFKVDGVNINHKVVLGLKQKINYSLDTSNTGNIGNTHFPIRFPYVKSVEKPILPILPILPSHIAIQVRKVENRWDNCYLCGQNKDITKERNCFDIEWLPICEDCLLEVTNG